MNKSVFSLAAAAITCLLGSQLANSTLLPSEQVSLATRDKAAIALLACNRPLAKDDVLDAIRLLETPQVLVEVTCESYGLIDSLPLLKVANCENTTGRWTCSGADAVRLQLVGREVVLSYDSRIKLETVLELANYAASVRAYNGREVAAYISGQCYLRDGQSVPFEGALSFNFGCGDWSGTITKDCGGEKCRLFFTQWEESIV
jgi:hypothetical protein